MKITYRPEIDGLRAIAVASVIIYHAQITLFGKQFLSGGFIGVDIFFVISGYLITSIIIKELQGKKEFSFKYFYERRIRRILPVLFAVMIASMAFAWIFLLPKDYINLSNSIISSAGFVSNFYFYFTGLEYAAETSLHIPFLHTWSLSVEEQFYILFPIILLLIFLRYNSALFPFLIIIFLISLLLANYLSYINPSLNFYILPTRLWELMAGSIISYIKLVIQPRKRSIITNTVFSSTGLILIILSLFIFDDDLRHPSFITLIPILGISLLIFFSEKGEIIARLLSIKIIVFFGLISYSLYLWHYPIFAFARITEFASGSLVKQSFLGILILILSVFTYYLVERPARNKNLSFKKISYSLALSFFIIVLFGVSVSQNEGYKNRVPEQLRSISSEPWKELKDSNNNECYNKKINCTFNSSSKDKVFLIGDSHMGSIMNDLKDKVISMNFNFITSTYTGCLFFPGFDQFLTETKIRDKKCNNEYFQKTLRLLSKNDNSIIIIGGRFPLYLNKVLFDNQEGGIENNGNPWGSDFISVGNYESIETSFEDTIYSLAKKNKIILVYPIPEVGWNVPRRIFYNRYNIKDITTSYEVYKKRNESSFKLLDSLIHKNIYRVYPQELFCDNQIKNRCVAYYDNKIFYADDEHPSELGAEMINNLIIERIKEINKK